MRIVNKKAEGEGGLKAIGKYILWIAVSIIAALGVYFLIDNLTTGI